MRSRIRTIQDLVRLNAVRNGNNCAVVCNGRRVTYESLLLRGHAAISLLERHIDIEKSNRIALYFSRKLPFLCFLLGIIEYGMTAMVIPEGTSYLQVNAILEKYSPAVVITDGYLEEKLIQYNRKIRIIAVDEDLNIDRVKPRCAEYKNENITPESEAIYLFTSGTTGQQKAVTISHGNIIETCKMINGVMALDRAIVEYIPTPLTHSMGLRRAFCNFLLGGTIVVDDGIVNPANTLVSIKKNRCTGFSGVPSIFRMITDSPFLSKDLEDIGKQIEYIELGSSPMLKEEKEKLCKIFTNATICMHYGTTEASRACFLHFRKERDKLHTVGRPSPRVDVKIVGEKKQDGLCGVPGEICIKGINVFKGYLMDQEMTDEGLVDGWYRSGDIGRFDEDGYLEFLGRQDDMINVGGKKMYPQEVENQLSMLYPNLDVAILPMPHIILGEQPVLCYSQECDMSDAIFQEVMAVLSTYLETYKIPTLRKQVQKIPKTYNGKIMRQELKKLING